MKTASRVRTAIWIGVKVALIYQFAAPIREVVYQGF